MFEESSPVLAVRFGHHVTAEVRSDRDRFTHLLKTDSQVSEEVHVVLGQNGTGRIQLVRNVETVEAFVVSVEFDKLSCKLQVLLAIFVKIEAFRSTRNR